MAARPGSARLDRWDALLLVLGALAIVLFLAAERRIAGAPGLPLDDSWIHLRLAQNLATGGGFGINRSTDSAVTLLPEPDSPTMPSVLPGRRSKPTPRTAWTTPFSE